MSACTCLLWRPAFSGIELQTSESADSRSCLEKSPILRPELTYSADRSNFYLVAIHARIRIHCQIPWAIDTKVNNCLLLLPCHLPFRRAGTNPPTLRPPLFSCFCPSTTTSTCPSESRLRSTFNNSQLIQHLQVFSHLSDFNCPIIFHIRPLDTSASSFII